MALTATEEALVRQLLDQQAAILSLAGNESTITSKLGATKVTLADLVAASSVADTDLLLMRQGTNDKSVTPALLKPYFLTDAATQKGVQAGDYNTSVAGGTADALTGDYTPNVSTLENGLTLYVRATAANATMTPTFSPDGLTAKTIVKANGLSLALNDIAGAGHWLALTYDAPLDKWVLANPAGASSDGELRSVQYFTSSGTWTKPAGLKRARVTVVGGGGSGSGGSYSGPTGGGGGAAGGTSIKLISAASLGATESVTVGNGGTSVGAATNGNAGGGSSFGSHCSATGGAGGTGRQGGVRGLGSGGNFNIDGEWGKPAANSTSSAGGNGGCTIFGGGGRGGVDGDQLGYAGGTNTGAGGGGGGYTGTTTSGAGAKGIVIVEEFF